MNSAPPSGGRRRRRGGRTPPCPRCSGSTRPSRASATSPRRSASRWPNFCAADRARSRRHCEAPWPSIPASWTGSRSRVRAISTSLSPKRAGARWSRTCWRPVRRTAGPIWGTAGGYRWSSSARIPPDRFTWGTAGAPRSGMRSPACWRPSVIGWNGSFTSTTRGRRSGCWGSRCGPGCRRPRVARPRFPRTGITGSTSATWRRNWRRPIPT